MAIVTTTDVITAYRHLKTKVYNTMHENIVAHDKLVDQDIECHVPKGESSHVPADALSAKRTTTEQIFIPSHSFKYTPSQTQEQKEFGAQLTEFFEWLLDKNDILNEASIGWELAGDIAMGFGALKGPIFDATAQEEGRCPILFYPINNQSLFPDPAGNYVIEAYGRYVGEVIEELRKLNESKAGKRKGKKVEKPTYNEDWYKQVGYADDYTEITWIVWHSTTQRCFAIASSAGEGGYPISEMQPNPLKYIPYSWAYSGWGKGKSSAKPEKRAIGILTGMESSIMAKARSYSALNISLRYNVYGRYLFPKESEAFFKEGYFAASPGEGMAIPREAMPDMPGGMQLMPYLTVNPDLYRYVAMSDDDIRGIRGSAAVQGLGPAGESGKESMYRIRQSALIMEPPRKALASVYSGLFTNVVKLIANEVVVEEPIKYGHNKSISPGKVIQPMHVKYELEPRDPIEDRETLEIGARLAERGLITIEMFAKLYAKFPNAATILEELLAERVLMKDPTLMSAMAADALEQAGYTGAAAYMKQMAADAQKGTGNKQTIRPGVGEQRLDTATPTSPLSTREMPGMGEQPGG